MFGYVTVAKDGLSQEEQDRYRALYCGLCRTLRLRHGSLSRLTHSYDFTFLYMLLSALYEPEEKLEKERCMPHLLRPHLYAENSFAEYCADMNVLLAYYKCRDDWQDERSIIGKQGAAALEKACEKVKAVYGSKCTQVEACLEQISQLEKADCQEPDLPANLTGKMLGTIYRFREDEWSDSLQRMGESLGRFIYLMDAWDDLEEDKRKKCYNPLMQLSSREDYEVLVADSLRWMIGECAREFETLPIIKDARILRNVLYAGCWNRYRMKLERTQMQKKQGRPE